MLSLQRVCLTLLLLVSLYHHLVAGQKSQSELDLERDREREKRGTVTIDFGLLLRNLLQKSAQLSSAKVDITKTILAAKTTRRPARTTTTTTTPAPPPPPPLPPRRRPPIYGGGWRPYDFHKSGYLPFVYDADYSDPPPPVAASTPRRVRPFPRPLSTYYAQKLAPPTPQDYDYDYDGGSAPPQASPPPPPPPPRRPPAQAQQQARRSQPPAQLSDQLVYQYAQPSDTSFKQNTDRQERGGGERVAERKYEEATDANTTAIEDNFSPSDNGNNVDDNGEGGAGTVPGSSSRFWVNYPDNPEEAIPTTQEKLPASNYYFGIPGPSAYLNFLATAPNKDSQTYGAQGHLHYFQHETI
ncbi:proline-, glutamic acid- and leucine-rich protein 1 [Scaptodrosophila lebanonensis]|uniref:Proline-, glutamic acid- and leucine-rich protein 1 n=1 Tax=Drosophila lebanonensis TaxID=7225 RepID=A0A6J2U4M1_DROLE|nr:proline-, glutamic acid- and leucine-rich protein 1 [Scaptodrosophila lebanonensis]